MWSRLWVLSEDLSSGWQFNYWLNYIQIFIFWIVIYLAIVVYLHLCVVYVRTIPIIWKYHPSWGEINSYRKSYSMILTAACLSRVKLSELFSVSCIFFYLIHNKSYCGLDITVTSWWKGWRLKSPVSRLFAQPFVQALIKEIIEAPHHLHLWGESTDDQRIPLTKRQ